MNRCRKRMIWLIVCVIFVSVNILDISSLFADTFRVERFKRKDGDGHGKLSAPLGTIRYPTSVKDGDNILVLVDGKDMDGDLVFVEFYWKGQLIRTQSRPPYGITLTKDMYGTLPGMLDVVVRDDYGNASRATVVIDETPAVETCKLITNSSAITGSNPSVEINGDTITLSFNGDTGEKVDASLLLDGGMITGSIMLKGAEASENIPDVKGLVTFTSNSGLKTLSATTSDGKTSLSCAF